MKQNDELNARGLFEGLRAPHAARSHETVRALVEEYEWGTSVPPIVAIAFGNEWWAICGSHRLAALRSIGLKTREELVRTGRLIVVPAARLRAKALRSANVEAQEILSDPAQWTFFPRIVGVLFDLLPPKAAKALRDEERC